MPRRVVVCIGAAAAAWFGGAAVSASETRRYDVAVIGGGVVGLAVARELAVQGVRTVVLEKQAALASEATGGNSGLGCTGYDAPEGSVERALLRRSISRHPNLYRNIGLSYRHVRKCGALVVAWDDHDMDELRTLLRENHQLGDTEAELLSADELREVEPALGEGALGALYVPREVVAEPWVVPVALARSALQNGADILLSTEVTGASRRGDTWRLVSPRGAVDASVVVNCAGLYGDEVEVLRGGGKKPSFTITPRKGEFVVFRAPASGVPSHIIQRVPTPRTKGVIVWNSMYGLVVVGPTADDQQSKTDRANNPDTIKRLIQDARDTLPALKDAEVVGTYAGLRPATQHRDYCIALDSSDRWVTVGGIRSTGLTAATGIAEYVAKCCAQVLHNGPATLPPLPDDPVEAPYLPSLPICESPASPFPSLADLQQSFKSRGDGAVEIDGVVYPVTHPLTALGMAHGSPSVA